MILHPLLAASACLIASGVAPVAAGQPGAADPVVDPAADLAVELAAGAAAAQVAPAPPLAEAVEVVATGYRFTEGPAAGPDGAVYFTDIPANRVVRYDPATGEAATHREDSGGANGLFFHRGDLYAAEGGRRRVGVYRVAGGGLPDASGPVAAQTGGVPFNKPNDLAVDAAGGVYFTDPDFTGRPGPKPPVQGVYYASPDGKVSCLVDFLERPNGVALHPDGTRLYVQDVEADLIYAFAVEAPGRLADPRVFATVADLGGGGPDGLCVDRWGRVYTALFHAGAVVVHDAAGVRLQVVATGPQTTNCVIGPQQKYLYVTADKSLKRIALTDPAAP